MTLGKKLKALRAEHNLSQPELAEKVGIEQSYLSKLENDKSIPSNDIFNQLLGAFNLSVAEFVSDIPAGAETERLKQISDVSQYFASQNERNQSNQRRYLYVSSILIVLATTLFYMGFSKQVFSEVQFQYESRGVVFEGEPNNILDRWRFLLTPEQDSDRDFKANKRLEMERRIDEKTLGLFEYVGTDFSRKTEGGSRYYEFRREKEVKRPINAWLQVFGVLLFSAGIMGFVLERRLFRHIL